ncbi:MAG: DotU family type IV/VI secretion system protein [Deltaproteobacteria bacterium]|nr:DotU family type IV/VI secretion system protein [Deltaproteobacteria bacterium]
MNWRPTEAGRRGGEYEASYFKDAQYIMAVLADETFLHMDWVGKDAWKSNLLELKLFGTNIAGDLFFKKIDKLLAGRDPAATEVSVLFLLALSFGFQGKFRGSDDRGQLDRYRRQLFTFIYQRNPDLLGESKLLFPEAYAYTLSMRVVKTLPYIRKWVWLLVAVIVTFLVLSFGLWTYLSSDLSRVIQEILSGG